MCDAGDGVVFRRAVEAEFVVRGCRGEESGSTVYQDGAGILVEFRRKVVGAVDGVCEAGGDVKQRRVRRCRHVGNHRFIQFKRPGLAPDPVGGDVADGT